MPPTELAGINVDCWLIIIDQLYGDFRTLSRLMKVSRQFLALIAPRLYGQLDDEAALQQMTHWSDKKRNGLAALLLVSSGYLVAEWTKEDKDNDYEELQVRREVWVEWTLATDIEHKILFKFPLFVNYFGLLKRLPKELIGEKIWSDFMNPAVLTGNQLDIAPIHSEEFNVQLAKVVTEIHMGTVQGAKYWLTMVNYLSKLLILRLPDFYETSSKTLLEEFYSTLVKFVKAYKARFPATRLTLIEGRWKGQQDYEHFLELNEIAGPEMIKVQRLERIGSMMARDERLTLTRNMDHFEFDMAYIDPWDDSTIPYLPENDLKVMACVANFLEKCRKLKTLHLLDIDGSKRTWTNVFTWAKKERAFLERDQRMGLSVGTKQQQPSSSPQPPLMQLKEFRCACVPNVVPVDVVDLFRNSLECLDIYQNEIFESPLAWSWPLTRLTSLQLDGCRFHFESLEYCTVLQDLSLQHVYSDDVIQDEDEPSGILYWRISISMKKSLRSLKLVDGEAAEFLDLDSLGDAQELESFYLTYGRYIVPGQNIKYNPSCHHWNLPKLKKLTLGTMNNGWFWQMILLKAAPNVEMHSTLNNWMDLSKDFIGDQVNGQKQSRSISSSNKSHDTRNVFTTKIRYLEFSDFYTFDRLEHLNDCLGRSKLISLEDLPALTLSTINTIQTELGFPFLTHIIFRSEPNFRKLDDVVKLAAIFENLILELLERPRMRWIRTKDWEPSKSFVERELTMVEKHHVPLKTREFIDNAAESGDEFTKSCCVLELNSSGRNTSFYQLKK